MSDAAPAPTPATDAPAQEVILGYVLSFIPSQAHLLDEEGDRGLFELALTFLPVAPRVSSSSLFE